MTAITKNFYSLILVTNKGTQPLERYLNFIAKCAKGGITSVQLREKTLTPKELEHFSFKLKNLLDIYQIPLIVNDNIELSAKLNANGVHLGQSDTSITKARAILGPNKIIGLSVNTIEQVQNSNNQPVDYIGVGTIFPTNNKNDVQTIWGLDNLKQASLIASHPIVAIGGIDQTNAASVIANGADGIAAIGAFHSIKDPFAASQNLIQIIKNAEVNNNAKSI